MNKYESDLAEQFISMFLALKDSSEAEVFSLCRLFNEKTGGKLSPYQSPEPVAISVIKIRLASGELRLLGIKRGISPKLGEIAFTGGFLNKLENGLTANHRELLEECPGIEGFSTESFTLMRTEITPSNQLLIFYVSKKEYPESIVNTIQESPEVLDVCLIGPDTPMAFPMHALIRDELFRLEVGTQ